MKQPNILFIMSDDHATSALSCYGSRINKTPQLDRIANEGMRFDNCFCTNALCSPSRASILTGLYSHLNGVRTLSDQLDGRQQTVAKLLQEGGYQTAMIGKWHLGHGGAADPTGFDYWNVLPEQGDYMNPTLIEMGERKVHEGYVTDIITDLSLDWMNKRDTDKPFFLMCYHKAPHRSWIPDDKHADMYEDMDILEPETFHDDYSNRAAAASAARMRGGSGSAQEGFEAGPAGRLNARAIKKLEVSTLHQGLFALCRFDRRQCGSNARLVGGARHSG